MRSSVGISLGAANLVAVADGRPTLRPAALTLATGVPATGFIERVGDPVPLVLADRSSHAAEELVAVAIDELIRHVSPHRRPQSVAVAVPAHWPHSAVAALRAAVPHLDVVSDASAALAALQANPGLPTHGVVALCDFGATGAGITLVDAGNGLAPIGETLRLDVFSGDLVDRALLQYVLAGLDADPGGTSQVASLTALREQCQAAKERLSFATATGLAAGGTTVRLTRRDMDSVICGPLDQFIEALTGTLYRHGVAPSQLAAIASVGGGARIPLVTQRLSEIFRRPVITGPYAQVVAAAGAELLAVRGADHDAPTVMAADNPATSPNPTMAAVLPPLAWSAETVDLAAADVDESVPDPAYARPEIQFGHHGSDSVDLEPLAWYRRPGVLFAGAACFAAMAVTGLVLTAQVGNIGPVEAGTSGIAEPVATKPLEAPAETVPPPPLTPTLIARPQPSPVASAAPQAQAPRQVVTKQAAPQQVPPPAAPPVAAPAPTPEPSPSPEPTPEPSPSPEPTPEPSPSPEPSPTPEPSPEPSPTPEPSPSPEPEPAPEPAPSPSVPAPEPAPSTSAVPAPAPEPAPSPEPAVLPSAEPAAPAGECVPSPDTAC